MAACSICLTTYTQSCTAHITKCGHMFHQHCLLKWFKSSKTCPQCRKSSNVCQLQRVYFNSVEIPKNKFYRKLANQIETLKKEEIHNPEELKKLNNRIETLEKLIGEADKTLLHKREPHQLGIVIAKLQKDLNTSEANQMDMRNLLRMARSNLRKETAEKEKLKCEIDRLNIEINRYKNASSKNIQTIDIKFCDD